MINNEVFAILWTKGHPFLTELYLPTQGLLIIPLLL